jgi:opacity protein-like surface antigen
MGKRTLIIVGCASALVLLTHVARSQTETTTQTTVRTGDNGSETHFRIGPQVGYFRTRGADDGKFMVGGAARLKLSQALGVEGSINYRQEEFHNGLITATSWPVMVTGLIYFVPVVYGAIGAGWYNTKLEVNTSQIVQGGPTVSSDTQQRFGWHFGGGVELPLDQEQRSAFVADIRYVFLDYNWDKFPGSEVNANFYTVMVGLQIGL